MSIVKTASKQWLFLLLVFCFSLVSVGTCSATYQVTEEQLTLLETNLSMLEMNNERLRQELTVSQMDLSKVNEELRNSEKLISELQFELQTLKAETEEVKNSSKRMQDLLAKAEASLQQYEKKAKQSKQQNRLLKYALVGVGVYAMTRR